MSEETISKKPPMYSRKGTAFKVVGSTFHLDRLREAKLVNVRREGRSMVYAARFDTMNSLLGYLSENGGSLISL